MALKTLLTLTFAILPFATAHAGADNNVGNNCEKALLALQRDPHYLEPLVILQGSDPAMTTRESRSYLQDTGTYLSWVAEHQAAQKFFDQLFPYYGGPADPMPTAYHPVDAVTDITSRAEHEQIVMINEAHHVPQGRLLTLELLQPLYERGYRYFAAETFSQGIADAEARGYPLLWDGYYLRDPYFAQMIREAIRIGYKLVPYEHLPKPGEVQTQNVREHGQALNLKERILDRDPHAKVLVHAGYGHIDELGSRDWTPMARYFRELTGINPLTVDQTTMQEHSERRFEHRLYQNYVGTENRPQVFVAGDDRALVAAESEGHYDVQVFSPRTTNVNGRPTWANAFGRYLRYAVPESLRGSGHGLTLVQAYLADEPIADAVPVDQVVLGPHKPTADLLLPPGKYTLRSSDGEGVILHVESLRVY